MLVESWMRGNSVWRARAGSGAGVTRLTAPPSDPTSVQSTGGLNCDQATAGSLKRNWSLRPHGVGHREIARREDSRNLADLRPRRLSLGPHAKANRAHTRGSRPIL